MRILVLSDSHGDRYNVERVMKMHSNADRIFHLGDGVSDIERYIESLQSTKFVRVKGNCDFGSDLNAYELVTVSGKKIYLTHGYQERVKYTTDFLAYTAREHEAQIALYGHTHIQKVEYDNGLYIFNPGSLHEGCYGLVDITPQGIMCIECNLGF